MADGFQLASAYIDVTARDSTKGDIAKIDQNVTSGVEKTA